MANVANVRFYRLATLPSFEAKHKGIFVHVTSNLTRRLLEDKVTYKYYWDGKLTDKEIQAIAIQKTVKKTVLVPEWMDSRRIDTVESGLWFGGENGWELLSNDTTDAAITAAIDAKIATLHADGYAQATISGSTLTISGIKEDNGQIAKDDTKKLEVAIDGTYNESTNKIATQSTVTNAIELLDVETPIQAVTTAPVEGNADNTVLTFKGIKEENGKIVEGNGTGTFTVGDAKLNIEIGADSFEVFSANATSNGAIKLDEKVFKKNVVEGKNVLSVITKSDVTSNNKLVTEQDIANLGGAMHYKGAITSANSSAPDNWPETVAAGDVYIATGNFVKDGNTIESGDLIVFNSATLTDYKVVQSNITLGTGDGQVAANVGALEDGKLVVGVNPATGNKGIKTVEFDVTNLTGTTGKNERKLTYDNGAPDTSDATLFHSATITDTFKVIGKDFNQSIKISSNNRSIEIARNAGENDSTGVVVDLIWNTSMDPDNQL